MLLLDIAFRFFMRVQRLVSVESYLLQLPIDRLLIDINVGRFELGTIFRRLFDRGDTPWTFSGKSEAERP